jgi:hypothetical protein
MKFFYRPHILLIDYLARLLIIKLLYNVFFTKSQIILLYKFLAMHVGLICTPITLTNSNSDQSNVLFLAIVLFTRVLNVSISPLDVFTSLEMSYLMRLFFPSLHSILMLGPNYDMKFFRCHPLRQKGADRCDPDVPDFLRVDTNMPNENIGVQHHQYAGGTIHQNDNSLPIVASLPPGEGESHYDSHGHVRQVATVPATVADQHKEPVTTVHTTKTDE